MSNVLKASADEVAIIGPVFPWRGGISLHTDYLAHALHKRCKVIVKSFSRQYPSLFYPGRGQKISEESKRSQKFLGNVDFCIDSLNPMTWLKAAWDIKSRGVELVILPWWSNFWFLQTVFFLLFFRFFKTETLLICHNSVPHDSNSISILLGKLIFKLPDEVIVHSKNEMLNINSLGRSKAIKVALHPPYTHYPESKSKLQRRAPLELLFFGFIRPYKGLDILLSSLELVPKQFFLTVAGECWGDEGNITARARDLGIEENIEFLFEYVDDDLVSALFERADVVVAPYITSTGSGVIPTAYAFGKPVLTTDVGSNSEIVINGESGWLCEAGSSSELSERISLLLENGVPNMDKAIQELNWKLSWENYAFTALSR